MQETKLNNEEDIYYWFSKIRQATLASNTLGNYKEMKK